MAQGIFLALPESEKNFLEAHTYTPSYRQAESMAKALGGVAYRDFSDMPPSQYFFLAMKPCDFISFYPELLPLLPDHGVVVSIMAGISVAHLQQKLGVEKVVRVMPNVSCRVRKGISLFFSSPEVKKNEYGEVERLFSSCSQVFQCDREEQLDRGMALSACGPGYLLELAMIGEQYLEKHGFSREKSRALVGELFYGTSILMEKFLEKPFEELQDMVTSRGGTTKAALDHLRQQGLWKNWEGALNCAHERGRELNLKGGSS